MISNTASLPASLMKPLGSHQGCSPAEALHHSQSEPSSGAHRASLKGYLASWNVRTQLGVEGSIEAARIGDMSVVDERKVDQLISKWDWYGVVVAGLQENEWCNLQSREERRIFIWQDVPKEGGSRQRG